MNDNKFDNFSNNDGEVIRQRETKHKFTRFQSEDYSLPLMLCEFIDNSISSYEESFISETFDEINYDNLTVAFTFDFSTEDGKVIIEDNANGMDYVNLKKAAVMYDNEKKADDALNQHGIGMKAASFWLAEDFYLITKHQYASYTSSLSLKTSDKSDRDECNMKALRFDNTQEKENKGTKITLEKICKKTEKLSFFQNQDKLNYLKIFIGHKYVSYIKKGLRIKISYKTKDSNANLCFDVLGFEIKPFVLKDFEEYIKYKNSSSPEAAELKINEFKKGINKIQGSLYNSNEKNESLELLCSKIMNNQEAIIQKDIIVEEEKYKANIGIISTNKIRFRLFNYDGNIVEELEAKKYGYNLKELSKLCKYNNLQGLNLFHHHRGINISPRVDALLNNTGGKKPYNMPFAKNAKSIDGNSTPVRLYGWVNLKNIKTEVNKTNLYIPEKDSTEISNDLENIWKNTFKDVLSLILKAEEKDKTASLTKSQIEKVNRSISAKTCQDFEEQEIIPELNETNNTHSFRWSFYYKGIKWDILFEEDLALENAFNVEDNGTELIDEQKRIVKYISSHSFWDPINKEKKNKFFSFAFPVIAALIMTEYEINNPQTIFGEVVNSDETKIFDILNFLTKNWKSELSTSDNDESEEDE